MREESITPLHNSWKILSERKILERENLDAEDHVKPLQQSRAEGPLEILRNSCQSWPPDHSPKISLIDQNDNSLNNDDDENDNDNANNIANIANTSNGQFANIANISNIEIVHGRRPSNRISSSSSSSNQRDRTGQTSAPTPLSPAPALSDPITSTSGWWHPPEYFNQRRQRR